MERDSDQLSVLFTWTALNLEQAGGVLLHYVVTLRPTGGVVSINLYVNYLFDVSTLGCDGNC